MDARPHASYGARIERWGTHLTLCIGSADDNQENVRFVTQADLLSVSAHAVMGYSAKAIANYFLKASRYRVSPLKLQKLVYLAHGWFLGTEHVPLVDDEYAEAWPFGPVFPSIYHEFKDYGSANIKKLATETEEPYYGMFIDTVPEISRDDELTIQCLEAIWKSYGKLSAGTLSSVTHADGSPWHTTKKKFGRRRNQNIPDEIIEEYYDNLRKKHEEKQKHRRGE